MRKVNHEKGRINLEKVRTNLDQVMIDHEKVRINLYKVEGRILRMLKGECILRNTTENLYLIKHYEYNNWY